MTLFPAARVLIFWYMKFQTKQKQKQKQKNSPMTQKSQYFQDTLKESFPLAVFTSFVVVVFSCFTLHIGACSYSGTNVLFPTHLPQGSHQESGQAQPSITLSQGYLWGMSANLLFWSSSAQHHTEPRVPLRYVDKFTVLLIEWVMVLFDYLGYDRGCNLCKLLYI